MRPMLALSAGVIALATSLHPASAASLRFRSSGDDWTLRIHIGGGSTSCDPWSRPSTPRAAAAQPRTNSIAGHDGQTTRPMELKLKARRTAEGVEVTATGANYTGGWLTRLTPMGFDKGLPTFRLENRRPRGLVTQAITPFTQRAVTPISHADTVRVVIGNRVQRVRVR